MKQKYLHNHKNFRQLIEITAQELNIDEPSLVEKDYWIMNCLYGLKKTGLSFELKGGTSLSKGYGIIHRFSEDLDIRIDPPQDEPLPFKLYAGKNHDKPKHRDSRKKYFDWLAVFLKEKIVGVKSVSRDEYFDDGKYRSGGIRLSYDTQFPIVSGVKEGILLEVGFDRTAPNTLKNISSWVLDRAISADIDIVKNWATSVPCYRPEYTFVEKLQAVVRKFRIYQESDELHENFMRHYYDVYQLLKLKEVQNFIGTKEYENFKEERFGGDDTKISNSQAFNLIDTPYFPILIKEYEKTKSLYYRGQITLEEILKHIQNNLDRL